MALQTFAYTKKDASFREKRVLFGSVPSSRPDNFAVAVGGSYEDTEGLDLYELQNKTIKGVRDAEAKLGYQVALSTDTKSPYTEGVNLSENFNLDASLVSTPEEAQEKTWSNQEIGIALANHPSTKNNQEGWEKLLQSDPERAIVELKKRGVLAERTAETDKPKAPEEKKNALGMTNTETLALINSEKPEQQISTADLIAGLMAPAEKGGFQMTEARANEILNERDEDTIKTALENKGYEFPQNTEINEVAEDGEKVTIGGVDFYTGDNMQTYARNAASFIKGKDGIINAVPTSRKEEFKTAVENSTDDNIVQTIQSLVLPYHQRSENATYPEGRTPEVDGLFGPLTVDAFQQYMDPKVEDIEQKVEEVVEKIAEDEASSRQGLLELEKEGKNDRIDSTGVIGSLDELPVVDISSSPDARTNAFINQIFDSNLNEGQVKEKVYAFSTGMNITQDDVTVVDSDTYKLALHDTPDSTTQFEGKFAIIKRPQDGQSNVIEIQNENGDVITTVQKLHALAVHAALLATEKEY